MSKPVVSPIFQRQGYAPVLPMDFLLQVVMPVSMLVVMWVIGTELSTEDFRRLNERRSLVVSVSVCQLVVLPAVVFGLFRAIPAAPVPVMAGMLIMSAGPGGGLSNMITAKAGGNAALSIALTSVGSVCCLATMPVVFALTFPYLAERAGSVELPVGLILAQLVVFMFVPVAAGIWCRHKRPDRILAAQPVLRRTTSVMLIAILLLSVNTEESLSLAQLLSAFPYALAFMSACAVVGAGFAFAFRLGRADTIALLVEYSFQSAAIPTVIVASILKRMDWLLFVGSVGVLQMSIGVILVVAGAWRGNPRAGDEV